MGYVTPSSYSYYSQYQERIQQTKKLAVSQVKPLQKINRFEKQYPSATAKGKHSFSYVGRHIDHRV